MPDIPQSIKKQIKNPSPDIDNFIDVIKGLRNPEKVHLAELFADQEIMQWITEDIIGKKWVPIPDDADKGQMEKHLLSEIEYWYRMGYDYIRVTGGVEFPRHFMISEDTAGELSHDKRTWIGSNSGQIQNWKDYENYQWPEVKDEDLWMYQFVADHLPDGMGLMACPASGFFEIPSELIGYESMAMMSIDCPELLEIIFKRVRDILCEIYRKIVDIDKVAGFFQGDDMGYKTGLLMSPDFFKQYSLSGHKTAAEIAHSKNKIYILHSCGQLEMIIGDLVNKIKIDAKQSYEDVICPVEEFYKKYSLRLGVVGGVDVNLLASADEDVIRKRVRSILENCHNSGRYALGSGNTIANYCKKENVLVMFDEAFSWS